MSFLDNARRAFGSKSEYDYEDRYEEDYEDYEEEDDEPKKSFFSFLGRREEKEDDYEENYESEQRPARSYSSSYSRNTTPRERYSSAYASKPAVPPAPTRSSLAGVEVTVHYPTSLDDATRIIREVKTNKITLIDVSGIATDNEARRVVDYIGGAAFGMDCPFERLCPSIFCIAPVGVKIDAKKNKY